MNMSLVLIILSTLLGWHACACVCVRARASVCVTDNALPFLKFNEPITGGMCKKSWHEHKWKSDCALQIGQVLLHIFVWNFLDTLYLLIYIFLFLNRKTKTNCLNYTNSRNYQVLLYPVRVQCNKIKWSQRERNIEIAKWLSAVLEKVNYRQWNKKEKDWDV